MGRMSSENDPLAVVVATLKDGSAEYPTKNTFIHFPRESDCHKLGSVQRFRTDPSSEARSKFHGDVDFLDSSATTSGSSTPKAFEEDASSSADSALSISSEDEATFQLADSCGISTPVSFGLWMPVFCTANAPPEAEIQRSERASSMLPQPQSGPVHRASAPYTLLDDGSMLFGFTHRRADGVEWGLDVIRDEDRQALLVSCVHPGGAIESWNRQVMGGPKADRAVREGDLIVSINNMRGCQAMMHEGRNVLWKIEVLRERTESPN